MKNYDWFRYLASNKSIPRDEFLAIINKYGLQSGFRQIGSIRDSFRQNFTSHQWSILQKRNHQLNKHLSHSISNGNIGAFMFPIVQEEYS